VVILVMWMTNGPGALLQVRVEINGPAIGSARLWLIRHRGYPLLMARKVSSVEVFTVEGVERVTGLSDEHRDD